MHTGMDHKSALAYRRAVTPIVANLILVALAAIGGTITMVLAQDIFNSDQISGAIYPESLTITGYDARDTRPLLAHDGNSMSDAVSGAYIADGKKGIEERMSVFLKNDSTKKVVIKEITFVGTEQSFFKPIGPLVPSGSYVILTNTKPTDILLDSNTPILESGQEVTLVFGMDGIYKVGRNAQLRITTIDNTVIVTTITIGDRRG